jgi:hypothetical protein
MVTLCEAKLLDPAANAVWIGSAKASAHSPPSSDSRVFSRDTRLGGSSNGAPEHQDAGGEEVDGFPILIQHLATNFDNRLVWNGRV